MMLADAAIIKRVLAVSVFTGLLSLNAIDLKSVLSDVIENNPEILQKRQELSAAEQELAITRSGYLPKIDVRSSVAKERANTLMTRFQDRTFNSLNSSFVLSQNLFSGFSTDSEMGVKRYKIEMKSHELEEKVNDISLRLIKSYLDVMKANELLEVERQNVKSHEELYRKITLKTQSGSGRMGDFKEVLAKLALSYVNTLTQDNNYNDAAAVLNTVMGHYLDVQNLEKPTIHPSLVPHTLEAAMSEAVQKNPSVLVCRSEIESAKKSVSLERSSYYPKVDAELNARSYDNASGTNNTDKTSSAMVTLSYNLYNGGSDEARLKRSLSQTYNAIERFHSVERDVAEKMTMAYNAYTVFNRQKPFLEVYSDACYEKKYYYQGEFDLGRRSLIDLLDSENEYSTARRKEVENSYELLYAFFRILAAKNELIAYFSIDSDGYKPKNYTLADHIESSVNSEHAPSVGTYPFLVSTVQVSEQEPISHQENNTTIDRSGETNSQKGFEYYLKAARQGDQESQCMMVHLYEQGIGTAKNTEKALYWKKRCAQKPKAEPLSQPHEKAKSLDERLKELGIILNGMKK